MNLRLLLFRACPRRFVRGRLLRELSDATASAFGCASPLAAGRGYAERWHAYAAFSAARAEEALQREPDPGIVRARLRERAFDLGLALRRNLGVAGMAETMAAARVVYGVLGIHFVGDAHGEITIGRCAFSRFYTPDVCRLMSALDEGLLAGLAGGGRLAFRQRITEGADDCRACFMPGEALS